jgi:hypothetical protein
MAVSIIMGLCWGLSDQKLLLLTHLPDRGHGCCAVGNLLVFPLTQKASLTRFPASGSGDQHNHGGHVHGVHHLPAHQAPFATTLPTGAIAAAFLFQFIGSNRIDPPDLTLQAAGGNEIFRTVQMFAGQVLWLALLAKTSWCQSPVG